MISWGGKKNQTCSLNVQDRNGIWTQNFPFIPCLLHSCKDLGCATPNTYTLNTTRFTKE